MIGAPGSRRREKFRWELGNPCQRVRLLKKVLQSELPGKEAVENIVPVFRQENVVSLVF